MTNHWPLFGGIYNGRLLFMRNLKGLLSNRFYSFVFLSVAVILLIRTGYRTFDSIVKYDWWGLQDYLFNYAGGFIRRGLTGEVIFYITECTGIPSLVVSYAVSIIAYIIVAIFAIYSFRRQGYAINVLIMSFMLGSIFMTSINDMRRDFIEMAIFIGIIVSYKRLKTGSWIVLGNICAIFAILLHEATFLFMVPVFVLMTNIRLNNPVKSISSWLPSIAAFIGCCLYKGTPEMLPAMCAHIREYAPEALANGDVPPLLQFVGKDTSSVIALHIGYNFTDPLSRYFPIPVLFVTLFYLIYIPFITVCMIKVFNRDGLSEGRQNTLVSLILFQFVMLLPMFTVLSCDLLRVAMYWMMSSVILWLWLSDKEINAMFMPGFNKFSAKVSAKCFDRRLPGKMVLTLCMLFVGICYYQRTFSEILYRSPGVKVLSFIKTIVESIFN